MLLITPRTVTFGSQRWENVASVAIDRSAHATVEEWTDLGPYAALADVPEQRVRIRVVQDLGAGDLAAPVPGDQAVLSLTAAPAAADSATKRLTATAVVLEVAHDLGARRTPQRHITLAAISADGAADPIAIEPVTEQAAGILSASPLHLLSCSPLQESPMPSSFKSLDLFGSGPHRFRVARQGQALSSELFQTPPESGTLYLGPVELSVTVRGRLVAATEAELWDLRGAIAAELLDPPAPGTLVDLHGATWADMSFVGFTPAERTDRGRVFSLAYEARFLRFRQYPQ